MEITRDDRELRKSISLVMMLFAATWALCILTGSQADNNSYTRYHMTITTGFFGTTTSILLFWIVKETLYFFGKPENTCLYAIIEPFCIILRVTLLLLFCRYVLADMTLPMLNNWLFIIKANWWKHSTDPFITNASYVNAFFCWIICTFLWINILWGFMFGFICLREKNYKFYSLLDFNFYGQTL